MECNKVDTINIFGVAFVQELQKLAQSPFRAAVTLTTRPTQIKPRPSQVTPAPTPSFRVNRFRVKTAQQISEMAPTGTPNQIPTLGRRVRLGIGDAFKRHVMEGQKPTVTV